MAKWPIVGYDGTTQQHGISNRWASFGGHFLQNVNENESEQDVFDTYTASNLRLYLSSWVGGAGVDDMIATFRVNGGAGSQAITINATGEHEDTSNTDSIVSGDTIDVHFDHSAGGHNDEYTVQNYQVTLDAGSDVPPLMASGGTSGIGEWDATVASFASLLGGWDSTTETDVEYTMRAIRVLRDLRIYVTFGSGPVIVVRKNQADTSLTVSLTGSGEFLDTSNTASYVAGDEADYDSDGAGGASADISIRSVEADTSSGVLMGSDASVGTSIEFFALSGLTTTTTEANVQVEAEDAATIQNLFVNCFTFAETRTIRTRKNAANGNLSVSVSGTGFFEDLVNTDSLIAEDDLAIQQDSGSAGTNGYLVAVEWETAVGIDPDEIMAALRTQGEQEPVRVPAEVVSYG